MTRMLLVLLLMSHYSFSLPFNTMDTRSIAMGGTGTGSAKPASAHLFNAALLSVSTKKPEFSLLLPSASVQSIFKYAHYQALTTIDDRNYGEKISPALTAMNRRDSATFNANREIFTKNTVDLIKQLNTLQRGNLTATISPIRFSLSRTSDMLGFSLYFNSLAFLEVSPAIAKCDIQLLKGYLAVLKDIDPQQPEFNEEKRIQVSCNERVDSIQLIDPGKKNAPISLIYHNQTDTKKSPLISRINVSGIAIAEAGFAMAHQFNLSGMIIALGITPKLMQIQTFHAYPGLKSLTYNNENIKDLIKQRKKKWVFNADIALALNLFGDDSIIAGLTITNLLNVDLKNGLYEPIEGKKVTHRFPVDKQIRAGFQLRRSPWLFAFDVDLSENLPVHSADKTQNISLGAEYTFPNAIFSFRAGAKNNLHNSADISLSSGFALSLKPLHIDVAFSYGFKSIATGLQFSFVF